MKFSKRTKAIATVTALFGVGTLMSTIKDLDNEIEQHIDIAQSYYNRSTDLEKFIYDNYGAETLAGLLNLSIDTVKEFGKYIYN